jgi:acetyl esterase/lipase
MPSAEHDQIAEMVRAATAAGPTIVPVEESRANLASMGELFSVPEDVTVNDDVLAGVAVRRCVPAGPDRPPGVIQYHHGGSYQAGSPTSHLSLTGRLAAATGYEVVSVDYRLAPEHPFPAGLEDALAVHRHLRDAEGVDPAHLVVAGDSAGGGLSLAAAVALRDAGEPVPAGVVLLSPWLDLTLSGASIRELADVEPMLRADALAAAARAYAPDRLEDPLVSPLFAPPGGLPPTLVFVGTAEILLDDARRYAQRAADAGVEVELVVEEGLIHVWPFIDGIPESAAAIERIAAWLAAR